MSDLRTRASNSDDDRSSLEHEKATIAMSPHAVEYDERFIDLSWGWLQDEELRQLTMTPQFTRADQAAWFGGLKGRSDYVIWGIESDGVPIGAFGIKNIFRESGEFWGYIGEKSCWGGGIGTWMVTEAINRSREIGLSRLRLKVWQQNVRAFGLYRRCGFKIQKQTDGIISMELDV